MFSIYNRISILIVLEQIRREEYVKSSVSRNSISDA